MLALVMPSIVPDLEGIELVGDHAEAVLVGGCDETIEPNQVFSYMNLSRAFSEIQMGASLYCLHKNKWWQTSLGPMLDSGAFVAGLEYATGVEATVLGKPSPSYFAAALDALGAEPELTWLVTDDVEADVRGARLFGMKTALVRTGKFRPEALESADTAAGHRRLVARALPGTPRGGPRRRLGSVKVGVDIIEIERIERALERPAFRERCFTEAERAYCDSRASSGAELRGPVRGEGSRRQGARLRCSVHVEGDRDRRAPEAGSAPLGSHGGVRRARPGRRHRPLDDALTRDRRCDRRREPSRRWVSRTSRSTPPPRCARPRSGTRATRTRSRS